MLSLFIAKKIHSDSGDTKRVSKPALTVATLGTAIGLAVMIISVAVVLGFKHSIRDKMVGFGSHIGITNLMSGQDTQAAAICASDSMVRVLQKTPSLKNLQPYVLKQGILKSDSEFLGIMFKGIDESWDSTFIKENLKSGSLPHFSAKKASNSLVISQIAANKLQLKVGDKIFAYFLGDNDVRTRRFTIAAIFDTNLAKLDEAICYTDLYTTQRLNGWEADQISGYELALKDFEQLDNAEQYVHKNVDRRTDKYFQTYTSATIQQSNPQMFSWLKLLDLNIWIILALMICVAAVTMTSGLMIIILERVQMIGVLKAIGARNSMIRHTFLWFASFVIIRGVIIGDAIGIGLCLLQRYTGLVKLDPTTYYVAEVPVEFNIPIFLLINLATILVCTLVLVAPSYLVSHIKPAKSIRFE